MNQTTNSIVVETKNLSKSFAENQAVKDLSLALERNKIYGFIGRNGSGKSTLMNLLTGEIEADAGTIEKPDNGKIVKVSSELSFPDFIRLDKIQSLFCASKHSWDNERFASVLNIFSLSLEAKFGNLSTGEKAGVKLAVLIAQRADVWLLDEATVGLDIISQFNCLTAILEYFVEDQPCIVFCSHNLAEIERLADDVLIMEAGNIVFKGPKEQLTEANTSFSETIYNRFQQSRDIKENDA